MAIGLAAALVILAGGGLDELAGQVRRAFAAGRYVEAREAAERAVASFGGEAGAWMLRGSLREALGEYAEAAADFSQAIERQPSSADLHNRRGAAWFKAGKIEASLADFDRAIELDPAQEPHHWQRGIAQYYAGRYAAGVRQFALHRQVNPDDVENAVWHFLCQARAGGFASARKALIPVTGDARVPMAEIHRLFAGRAKPEEVLAAAATGPAAQRTAQLFYAHLYVGLFQEAAGDPAQAREHLARAVREHRVNHYMWDVARVHLERMAR